VVKATDWSDDEERKFFGPPFHFGWTAYSGR
jgi:hypothetical protein